MERFPTAASTHLGGVLTPTPTLIPTPSLPGAPPPRVTEAPALALPDETGTTVACSANTLRISLAEGGRVSAVSRIAASGEWLYLLVDGGLYRTRLLDADAGSPALEPLLIPGQQVANRPAQELLDLAVDEQSFMVYVLDKIGHVFRYDPFSKQFAVTYRAAPSDDVPDDLPYDLTALAVDSLGRVVLLDSAHGALVTPEGISTLEFVSESRGLTASTDLTFAGDRFYTMQQNGAIRTGRGKTGSDDWRDANGTRLGLSLLTSRHLGVEVLYVVDGVRRQVDGLLPSGQTISRHVFAFAEMGLLRDVAFAGGRMYAVADTHLYVFPGPSTGQEVACPPPPSPEGMPRPWLYGYDPVSLSGRMLYPIVGGSLPPWPRVYPGAARIYRMGVHRGLDIYAYNAPRGYTTGWPVAAMMDGAVTRATVVYDDMSEEEFDAMLAEAEASGMTPASILDRLEGKQVILDHGNGLTTVYAHLDEIAPGVVTGARISAGQIIGSVGVTGTEGESRPGTVAPHLHVEIWFGDRYLGFGISVREAMWWFEQLFPPPDS